MTNNLEFGHNLEFTEIPIVLGIMLYVGSHCHWRSFQFQKHNTKYYGHFSEFQVLPEFQMICTCEDMRKQYTKKAMSHLCHGATYDISHYYHHLLWRIDDFKISHQKSTRESGEAPCLSRDILSTITLKGLRRCVHPWNRICYMVTSGTLLLSRRRRNTSLPSLNLRAYVHL